jgi:hypothetical protein
MFQQLPAIANPHVEGSFRYAPQRNGVLAYARREATGCSPVDSGGLQRHSLIGKLQFSCMQTFIDAGIL